MKTTQATRRGVSITFVTHHYDGTESVAVHMLSPIKEATCQSMISAGFARFFEAPVHESCAPGSLIAAASPITKIECSLQILNDTVVMEPALDFPYTQFAFGYD
jgi:hypothetical protein